MATITEDYVSFETAKLLKEKGFDESCYQKYDNEGYLSFNHVGYINNEKSCDDFYALAPTLQMAMKWLREIYNLFFEIGFGNDCNGKFLYMTDIYDLTNNAVYGKYKPIVEADDYLTDNPKTYEDAVEAALKYCLENLI